MTNLDHFRSQFPILDERAFLFSGALTPAARPVSAAFNTWTETWIHAPLKSYNHYHGELEALRVALGKLIGADPDEIAITENTSAASNLAVRMLATDARQHVVVDDTTYPSSLYPWLANSDKKIRYVATDDLIDPTAAFTEAVDDDCLAVTVTHVGDLTGRRHQLRPIADIAHAHGAHFLVDVAQSAGIVPIDVRADGIDIAAGTFMKWLLGPPGLGFLYVRRDLISQLPLLDIGYEGVAVPWSTWPQFDLPTPADGARRYQLGVPSLPALAAARAGVQMILDLGVDQIHATSNRLVARCLAGLQDRGLPVRTPTDASARAGVIAFDEPYDKQLETFLRDRHVDVGALGFGCIRVDPHAFNNEDDIDRFLDGLDEFRALNDRAREEAVA